MVLGSQNNGVIFGKQITAPEWPRFYIKTAKIALLKNITTKFPESNTFKTNFTVTLFIMYIHFYLIIFATQII